VGVTEHGARAIRQSTRLLRGNDLNGRGSGALAVLLAVGLLALPVSAGAACGGVRTSKPAPHQKRNRTRAPLAIGDSVMLLALDYLARRGFEANAHGCRGFQEGLALLRHKRHVGRLPHLTVVALGADFNITRGEVKAALRILGPDRVLGLVTPRELGGGSGSDAAVVRAAGRRWPNRVKVLDWVRRSRGHGSWFQPDGLHLTYSGALNFARLFKHVLKFADPPAKS
jgi:hypothetical protein